MVTRLVSLEGWASLWEETFKTRFLLIFSWVCSVLFSDTEKGLQWFVSPALSFFSRINLLQLMQGDVFTPNRIFQTTFCVSFFFGLFFNGLHGCWHMSSAMKGMLVLSFHHGRLIK
jgi:hypothetical protein